MSTILIVEDDRLLANTLKDALEQKLLTVVKAETGIVTFKQLDTFHIDLVFLDIILPGTMDGWEILRTMKRDPRYKDIPVMILSNVGHIDELEHGRELRAIDYIVKSNTNIRDIVELCLQKIHWKG